jgi:RNA polymerase sigma factor (TIGR02999 family)
MDPDPISLIAASDEERQEVAMDSVMRALVAAAERSDRGAAEALFSALYEELRRLAQRELAYQRGAHVTIGVKSLLHEAYMVICGRSGATFADQGHFMAYAARVMRGLIIDHARNRRAQKRGGQFFITSLDVDVPAAGNAGELEGIGDALAELTELAPALAEVVDLKFFCGFSFAEIAAMRGVSERTVQRSWEKARLYLHRTMRTTALD